MSPVYWQDIQMIYILYEVNFNDFFRKTAHICMRQFRAMYNYHKPSADKHLFCFVLIFSVEWLKCI